MLRSQFYQRTRFTSETRLAQSAFTFHPHVLAPCTFPCMLRGLFWLSFFGPSHLIIPIFAISRRPSTSCAAEVFLNTFGNVSLELGVVVGWVGGLAFVVVWSGGCMVGELGEYFWNTFGVLLEYFWSTFGEYFRLLLEYITQIRHALFPRGRPHSPWMEVVGAPVRLLFILANSI